MFGEERILGFEHSTCKGSDAEVSWAWGKEHQGATCGRRRKVVEMRSGRGCRSDRSIIGTDLMQSVGWLSCLCKAVVSAFDART